MFRVSLFKRERTNDATRDPYAHKRTKPGARRHRAGGPSRLVMLCSGGARPVGARGFRVASAERARSPTSRLADTPVAAPVALAAARAAGPGAARGYRVSTPISAPPASLGRPYGAPAASEACGLRQSTPAGECFHEPLAQGARGIRLPTPVSEPPVDQSGELHVRCLVRPAVPAGIAPAARRRRPSRASALSTARGFAVGSSAAAAAPTDSPTDPADDIPAMPMLPPLLRPGQRGKRRASSAPPSAHAIFEMAFDPRFQLIGAAFERPRRRLTAEQAAAQVEHDDVQEDKRADAAAWLAACVRPALRDFILGGDAATRQVPDEGERDDALRQLFLSRAGPDGSACGKARRALQALHDAQPDDHMPATRLLINRVIARESVRAMSAAVGSQGGTTVAASRRAGFVSAYNMGFPVDVGNLLVDAAAPPARKRARQRRSGSIPIKWYFAFEHWAATLPPGLVRTWVRSLLIAWLHARLRFVDVLRAYVRDGGVAPDGARIVQIITKFSKDGCPLDVYIRASGAFGRWGWIDEYLTEVREWRFCLPAFDSPKGHKGDIAWAKGGPLPRVVSRAHATKSLPIITAAAPLGATAEVWKALGVGQHSAHGSPSDMAAVVGPHAPPDVAMTDVDERELGHWRRIAAAPSSDGELQLEPELQEAVEHAARQQAQPGAQQAVPRAVPPLFDAEDAEMRVRYTQGTNREGRRRAQLRVHLRWVTAMTRAVTVNFGGPWESLPGDRSEYEYLENLPGAEAPVTTRL